jgi:GNAT superfamily N-acetyltransferase
MNPGSELEAILGKVGPENLSDCGIGCLSNRKHEGYGPKVDWLQNRFSEGLRFLLFRDEKGKPLAFLEYVPGEFAWRPVHAEGWLFIHCLWVYSAGRKIGGLGSRLIHACVEEARRRGAMGVAAMVSEGPWMAGSEVFLRNGFEEVAEQDRFKLVVHRLTEGPEPGFRNISGRLSEYEGLHLVYSAQCPMVPKSVNDLAEMAAKNGLELKVTKLTWLMKPRTLRPTTERSTSCGTVGCFRITT